MGMKSETIFCCVLLSVLSVLVVPVAALNENMQNATDVANDFGTSIGIGTMSYLYNTGGGNSLYTLDPSASNYAYLYNTQPEAFTYAAATYGHTGTSAHTINVQLRDVTNTATLASFAYNYAADGQRAEVIVSGGKAYLYINGVLVAGPSAVLASTPYYMWFGGGGLGAGTGYFTLDDIVIGSGSSPYVLGMPDTATYSSSSIMVAGFQLVKDQLSPASNGLQDTGGNVVNLPSRNVTMTFSKNSATNESISLIEAYSGTVYNTQYTGAAYTGTVTWPTNLSIINASAPYGVYQAVMGTNGASNYLYYRPNGASIYFDQPDYTAGDTATITYSVTGSYWDANHYKYYGNITDVYGNIINRRELTTSSGSYTYQWDSGIDQGVKFITVDAKQTATGALYQYGFDYCSIDAYVNFRGYVNDAETAVFIPSANVSMIQGSTVNNVLASTVNGNYSTYNDMVQNVEVLMNVTATGYRPYTYSLTPRIAKTINLNYTLMKINPVTNGTAIGGVVRDDGYGNPIKGATIWAKNLTDTFSTTTNNAGGYLCDAGTPCSLIVSGGGGSTGYPSGKVFDMWATKPAFNNSVNYSVVAP